VLVHRRVLAAMEPPWFQRDAPGKGGEDRKFFIKAKAAGFQGYVDRSVIVGHLSRNHPVAALDFAAWLSFSQQAVAQEEAHGTNDGGDLARQSQD
jgi:hypothetical protein